MPKAMKHSKPAFASLLLIHSRFTTCFSFTLAAQTLQGSSLLLSGLQCNQKKGKQPLQSISKLNRKYYAQARRGGDHTCVRFTDVNTAPFKTLLTAEVLEALKQGYRGEWAQKTTIN